MTTPIIHFESIYAGYDIDPILKNVNLTINAGENWAILGANGSGKSTLIKLIANDLYPHAKYPFTKQVFGRSTWNIFELKHHLGIITNDLHNKYELHGANSTALEVVLSGFYSAIGIHDHHHFSDEQRYTAQDALETLDIADIYDKPVNQMSTGQLRRCIIARALIHQPQALILDEPTVGLDIKAQHQFLSTLRRLSADMSIILVTHHVEEIFPEISHVALVHNHGIHRQGSKADILTSAHLSEIFDIPITLHEHAQRYSIAKVG